MSLSSKHTACLFTKHDARLLMAASKQGVCPSRAAHASFAPIPPLLPQHPAILCQPSGRFPALAQPGALFLPPAQKLSSCCTSHQQSRMPEGNSPEILSCTPPREAANTSAPQCKPTEVPPDFIHNTEETSEAMYWGRIERQSKHVLK